ncbi:hypothetical protein [Capnocytophaga felis]|uniref:Uncharacterized protein n=1 Tax=Capnocytophaga felis TaxID=2267611 RepID=A0A5M4B721_9FLAO|nr:hypothetical protein [Capnocytophaga felis]GET45062.1 hypothetical protein RCZ01_03640 [Capnocytophaga felis]GET47774.1 hypothetical protein RCZ02_06050 [Capnocytophaga felis]
MKNTLKLMAVAFSMFAFSANVQAASFDQEVQIVQEKDGVKQEKKSCCKKDGKKKCDKSEKSCSKEGKEKKSCCKKNKEQKK